MAGTVISIESQRKAREKRQQLNLIVVQHKVRGVRKTSWPIPVPRPNDDSRLDNMQGSSDWPLPRMLICSIMRLLIACARNGPRLSALKTACFPACSRGGLVLILSRTQNHGSLCSQCTCVLYRSDVVWSLQIPSRNLGE